MRDFPSCPTQLISPFSFSSTVQLHYALDVIDERLGEINSFMPTPELYLGVLMTIEDQRVRPPFPSLLPSSFSPPSASLS